MTQDLSSTSATYESTNGGGVRDQARQVGSDAASAGGAVAQTAKEQGQEVVGEAKRQARDLYGEARNQVAGQAGQQQQRAASGLRSLADEMRSMAQQGGGSGPVTELAHQAAERVHGVAGWLEQREPGDLLNEVKGYARRNPGTFLVGAALLGVVAGRLTRNIAAVGNDGRRRAVLRPGPDRGHPDRAGGAGPDAAGRLPSTRPRAATPSRTRVTPRRARPTRAAAPRTPGPTRPGGTGQPLPPPSQTDPLPGVPSTGAPRP